MAVSSNLDQRLAESSQTINRSTGFLRRCETTRIYLITHPDTVIDSKRPINLWRISRQGQKQVKTLSSNNFWRDVECIFASTEPKAKIAAEAWAIIHKIPLRLTKGIEEIDRSSTEYLPKRQLLNNIKSFYCKPRERVRGWESAEHALKRMIAAMTRIERYSSQKGYVCIAVVTHGVVGNLYVAYLRKIIATLETGQRSPGSWLIIDSRKKRIGSHWNPY